MTYLWLFVIKSIDNVILTMKSLAVYKNQKMLSSIYVTISQLLFYLIVTKVVNDNNLISIFIVSIASGIGNYVAFLINDKFKQDDKWQVVLTTSNIEDVKRFCTYLAECNIKYIANDGYNRKGEKTINIIAYSKTKEESRLIEKFLEQTENKYLKEIMK